MQMQKQATSAKKEASHPSLPSPNLARGLVDVVIVAAAAAVVVVVEPVRSSHSYSL
jgi:hypothetical protein